MNQHYAVIMAGGIGTRLWPESTSSFPKQFLRLLGNKSLIQQTVERISDLIPPENVLVITNEKFMDLVKEQLPQIPFENIFGEPIAKNTAPCIALAERVIHHRNPDAVMCVLPADHVILDSNSFKSVLKSAFMLAQSGENIVTIGIEPTHPETGYGYIHFNRSSFDEWGENSAFKVSRFTEKPDLETAKEFIESGNYLWNSGMFVWSVKTIQSALEMYLPKMFEKSKQYFSESNNITQADLFAFFENVESVSVDYGIMEKAQHVFVIPGSFGWNDVGSWSAVYSLQEKDDSGNAVLTQNGSLVNTSHCYVSSKSGKVIALVGVENLAVIETDEAILVCNLDSAQDVKKITESLKKK